VARKSSKPASNGVGAARTLAGVVALAQRPLSAAVAGQVAGRGPGAGGVATAGLASRKVKVAGGAGVAASRRKGRPAAALARQSVALAARRAALVALAMLQRHPTRPIITGQQPKE